MERLAPVAFNQDPTATAAHPVRWNPMSMTPWWNFPTAGLPDISPAIPPVITGDPDVIPARSHSATLDHSARRRNPNHDISCERACEQPAADEQRK
jgi:hypothetical protein